MVDRLNPGERLGANESIESPDGRFSLVLQPDGNLVLYDQNHQPVWASGTDGLEVASATMQEDGNLVLYSSSGDPVWASDTFGNGGAYVVVQDDRNVVIYDASATPLWATNTLV
jgi:hypothetical protein